MSDGKKKRGQKRVEVDLLGRRIGKRDSAGRLLKRAETREAKRAALKESAQESAIEECVKRTADPKEREAFRGFLRELLENNAVPLELLSTVPMKAKDVGKTRSDQLYDACLFLAFPEYRASVRDRAFGPLADPALRYWRALFPKELGLSQVVIRARSFQEAFALGCDYACRLYFRTHKCIPADMTVRIQFMSDRKACRMLDIRHAVRDATRKASNLRGRKYSTKDIAGARIVAIGRKDSKDYEIFKYADLRDINKILRFRSEIRTSAVDIETFRPKETPSTYDDI